jgi:hypothetical protein
VNTAGALAPSVAALVLCGVGEEKAKLLGLTATSWWSSLQRGGRKEALVKLVRHSEADKEVSFR